MRWTIGDRVPAHLDANPFKALSGASRRHSLVRLGGQGDESKRDRGKHFPTPSLVLWRTGPGRADGTSPADTLAGMFHRWRRAGAGPLPSPGIPLLTPHKSRSEVARSTCHPNWPMISRLQQTLACLSAGIRMHPDRVLWCIGVLLTLLIQPLPAHHVVSDSVSRFRDAHWIWSGEDPGGQLPGLGGLHHHWYGVGQALLFLLPDWVMAHIGIGDLTTRVVLVFYLLFPTINGLVLATGWHAARELGFDPREAAGGVLILAGCTTLLWHFQTNQENPLMLFLALVAVVGVLRWDRTGSLWWLHTACAAQAWNVLIRLPNLALVLPLFGLPFLARMIARRAVTPLSETLRGSLTVAGAALPWLAIAGLLDRVWQRIRFGGWTGTYMGELGTWARANVEGLPPDFPFSNEFLPGVLQFFTSPAKSLLVYEPLVLLAILPWFLGGFPGLPERRALLIAAAASIVGTIVGLARCVYWSGEPSWGPRFIATPAHLLQLLSAIAMFQAATTRNPAIRIPARATLVLLFGIQIASIWLPAYHETLVHRGPADGSRVPIGEVGYTDDWRIVDRPITVISEMAHQIRDPEGWASSRPPQRILVPVRPFSQLRAPVRWGLRAVWASGLLVLLGLVASITRPIPASGSPASRPQPETT